MSLFGKKKKEEYLGDNLDSEEVPSLPELPKLPDFPQLDMGRNEASESFPQLPSYPSNSFGEKFSQNVIKDAVSGEKEGEEEFEADEFLKVYNKGMMQKPLTREISGSEFKRLGRLSGEIPEEFRISAKQIKEEPIFIRIDKFEESLQIFDKIKDRIMEMEKMLKDTERLKEEEEKEIELWEKEIQTIKEDMEKIDKDIFSKIE